MAHLIGRRKFLQFVSVGGGVAFVSGLGIGVFAGFGGWDAAGAKWFGYPTVWINRLNAPLEELGISADKAGNDLRVLQRFVESY